MPELIACPSCHNKISERAITCPKCGSERQKQCMVCKKFIMIDSMSCPECGDPNPFDEQLFSNKESKKYETKITAISIPKQDNEEGYEKNIKTTKAASSKIDSGSNHWIIYTKGNKIEAVRHGFCWPAFFFTFGWAIFKRLWLVAISYLVIVNYMEFMIYDRLVLMGFKFAVFQGKAFKIDFFYISLITLELIFRFAFGYSANKLVASRLEKKGYWKGMTFKAKNKQSAIKQYKQ
jgi:RNA polymerase subunit RPABC4/transcription elongation factor Spt4